MTTIEKISPADKIISFIELDKNFKESDAFIREIKEAALESFRKQGLPNRKSEEYKYSPVAHLFKSEILPSKNSHIIFDKNAISKFRIPDLDCYTLVFVDGVFSDELSECKSNEKYFSLFTYNSTSKKSIPVIEKHFGKYANCDSDPFIALNTAAFREITAIDVPDNTVVDKPIVLLNIICSKTEFLISTRNLIHVGKNSSANFIELIVSVDQNEFVLNNSVTEIVLEEGAKTLFYKIQDNCPKLNLISTTQVLQKTNSHFDTHTVTIDGSWIRNNLNIVPDGENCETHLNGLFIMKGNQHLDNHTLVDHRKPHCESNQLYRGILNDKSTGVFNGKIYVRPDAQKTNAYQSSKNMLLSDDASINTKPQLEIYADDVKCSHGSSTGQIDEQALFYLRARGISPDSARSLLMLAFARDVVDTIRIDALRNYVAGLVEKRLI